MKEVLALPTMVTYHLRHEKKKKFSKLLLLPFLDENVDFIFSCRPSVNSVIRMAAISAKQTSTAWVCRNSLRNHKNSKQFFFRIGHNLPSLPRVHKHSRRVGLKAGKVKLQSDQRFTFELTASNKTPQKTTWHAALDHFIRP
jgi:hypothetical protein